MSATPRSRGSDTPTAAVEVLDEGALVLRWAPAGRDPVLFAHPDEPVRSGRPPHAGVPVCWPWFGPASSPGAPSHGFVRTAGWRHLGTTTEGGTSTMAYRITSDDVTHPAWPHPYRLDLVVESGEQLVLSLTTTNTGEAPVALGEALHAYLAVGDVRRVVVRGLDGSPVHDKVTGEDRTHTGDLVLAGETDRVYRTDAPVTVEDPVLGRQLVVTAEGAGERVVWNPWADKAAGIDDVGDAWPTYLCVEAANTAPDAVTVQITGNAGKIADFLRIVEPFGIRELVQSGMVAIGRGSRSISERSLRPVSVPAPTAATAVGS